MRRRIRVVAALIESEGKILIAQRRGDDSFGGKWEFPGGKVEEGEGDREALRREIREELGVELRVGLLECESKHDYPELSVHILFYRSELISGKVESSKAHQSLAWVRKRELEQYDFLEADRPFLTYLSHRP